MPDQEVAIRESQAAIGQPAIMSDDELRRLYRIAEGLAASGVFKDAKQAAEVFAKLVVGRDLGLNTAQSMQGLYFVKGAVQIAYPMLGAFVRRHPDYDYTVEEHTTEKCRLMFWYKGDEAGVSEFTMEDAKLSGHVKPDSAWKTATRNMLFARAMSNGCKWFCPDVLGGVPVYVEGEIVPDRAALTAGTSDAEPQGLDLGPKVEKVLERAAKLGHAGLADRATVEVTLGSRSPDVAAEWCRRATVELDAMEATAGEPADAEVVGDEPAADQGALEV